MHKYWKKYWNTIPDNIDEQSQVGRTVKKIPITDDVFERTVNWVADKMLLNKNSVLLELCCGNGNWTIFLAKCVKYIYAVDFSAPLLNTLRTKCITRNIDNVKSVLQDVSIISCDDYPMCSHVLLYFALQHFSERETVLLFEKVYNMLKNFDGNAIFYIGDIPDRQKLWDYANTKEYERMYFDSIKNSTPSIGTWFIKDELMKIADYAGFSACEILDQPEWQINSRYRFDMKLGV